MSKPIIEVKNLSKQYTLLHKLPYYTLRETLTNAFQKPLNALRQKKSPAEGKSHEKFLALDNLNFSIKGGERVGIIGRNGAGKSTLLKILSRITPPTNGEIHLRGLVASLLEVGTGFHPELTGRENIYLNGAILGMKQKVIAKKFDDIVTFAEIEKFLDTPVKRYSSGMYVRLAFAVAAHLDPEILIVDEVLAVGDAQFQKKCIEKMKSLESEERTILYVSHNLLTVQDLCQKAILLENGKIKKIGATKEVIDEYINNKPSQEVNAPSSMELKGRHNQGEIRFTGIKISNSNDSGTIQSDDKLKIVLKYSSGHKQPISDVRIVVNIISQRTQEIVLRLDSDIAANSFSHALQPEGEVFCETEVTNLIEGTYTTDIGFLIQGTMCDLVERAAEFEVVTDINKYGFKKYPDKDLYDFIVRHSFKQP